MKKFYFLVTILAIFSTSFSSCKKDSGDTLTLSQKLVGQWRQVSVRNISYTNGIQDKVTEDTNFDPSAYIRFNNNGTIIYGSNKVYDQNGIEGDIFHYTVEDNLLKITDDKGIMMGFSAKITLTGAKLTLQKILMMPNTDKGDLMFESNFNFVKVK